FYGGIENILKRISRFYEVNLPSSELWHVELFKRFCDPPLDPLPIIFDKSLSQDLAPFRKFRHVGPRPFTMSLPRLRLSVLHPKSGTNKHRRYMITQSKVKFYTPHDNVNAV
ncbi:MAG TPA: hypothetical protein PKH98_06940, partial [Candidatus Omnitrophota bacterium]|nr:hypothetical protein [Candidatus Omnitrophota bacterium]